MNHPVLNVQSARVDYAERRIMMLHSAPVVSSQPATLNFIACAENKTAPP